MKGKKLEPEFKPDVRNVSYKVVGRGKGQRLVISVDLSKEIGPSKTGRSINVATTGGLIRLDERPEMRFVLNVFKPKSAIRRKLLAEGKIKRRRRPLRRT